MEQRSTMPKKNWHSKAALTLAIATIAGLTLAGCSSSGTATNQTLKIVYEKTDSFTALDTLFKSVKTEFEKTHKGVKIELQPVAAADDDYKTKLALSQRSAETAPDVFYEDTTNVRSDADAGYLLNLDKYVAKWEDWSKFNAGAKTAGAGDNGSIYAVSLGTDTRVIWYNKNVLEKAGVSTPWQPKSWNDILTAARKIKAAEPGVIPFNLYAGTGTGEGTVMQGFYELLYGTDKGANALYDQPSTKWVVGSQGFTDSLQFMQTLYGENLAVTPAQALDANVWKSVFGEWFPQDKLGGTIEGSYSPSFWVKGGSYPWADYAKVMGTALFPTQKGQKPVGVSMSGGWTLAVGAKTKSPQLAFDFLALALNKENALSYDNSNAQIAVRSDVAADPSYVAANPFVKAVTDAVSVTHFRPATSDYTKISTAVQKATESVITGQASPKEAAATYDSAVTEIVGAAHVTNK
jgi:multiple sugar transport system substrate-binding protein